jgi:hypothetical protein
MTSSTSRTARVGGNRVSEKKSDGLFVNTIFHFLPDQILVFSGKRYAAIPYNQGNGPALDVEATLEIDDDDPLRVHEFSIGCLAVDEQFQFSILRLRLRSAASQFSLKSRDNVK